MIKLKDSKCPECGVKINAATCMTDDSHTPVKGDISICIRCDTILKFNAELELVVADMSKDVDAEAAFMLGKVIGGLHKGDGLTGDMEEMLTRIANGEEVSADAATDLLIEQGQIRNLPVTPDEFTETVKTMVGKMYDGSTSSTEFLTVLIKTSMSLIAIVAQVLDGMGRSSADMDESGEAIARDMANAFKEGRGLDL